MHSQSPQWTEHRFRVVTREALKIGIARPVIINPQAAPRVYILSAMAIPPKSANQFRHTLHGGSKRIDFGNLRSDMYADANNLEMPNPRCLRIQLARLVDRNPKLVLLQSGRNVRMRVSGDIGITRNAIRALSRARAAHSASTHSSDSLSTLNSKIRDFSAAPISSEVFPTPEKTTFLAARRSTRRTRSSSPPETTSKPQPALPISRNMPRFEFAFTE